MLCAALLCTEIMGYYIRCKTQFTATQIYLHVQRKKTKLDKSSCHA